MNRRDFLAAALATPALAALAAACGDDEKTAIDHPTGAADVVLKITYEGGFVAPGTIFVNLPALLISGDGHVFTPGVMTMEFPGPLLPAINTRTITDAGIEKVLQLAADAGMLAAAPDYAVPEGIGIADASDTVLTIQARGTTYVHRANALGFEGTSTPARDRFAELVDLLGDLTKVAGASNLGAEEPLVAEQYRFQAMVVDPANYDPAPTVVEWPAATGVVLADSLQCATVAADAVGDLFSTANQLTFFEEADLVYQLSVVAVLPGDALC